MLGTIKRVNEKGFGFISPDGDRGQGDHFFHAKHLQGLVFSNDLRGQRVEFDSSMGAKGLQAENVRPAN